MARDKGTKQLYAIVDTEKKEFWLSGMNRVAYATIGTAKTAFASSANNPLRCRYSEQTRFIVVEVDISMFLPRISLSAGQTAAIDKFLEESCQR